MKPRSLALPCYGRAGMARAAAVKGKKGATKKPKGVKVKVPTRKVSVTQRAAGKERKHEVVVETKLEVAPPPKPSAPPARPLKLEGTPLEVSRRFYEVHGLP